MKKQDIITAIADKMETTKKEAGIILDVVVDVIKEGIIEDGEVDIPKFVKFTKVHKEATTARNPMTGAEIDVPAKDVPKAKFSSTFKAELV